ncbi:hypothetical protein JIM95_003775 [Corynebacterium sp. CCM 8835]|uniref:Uncharacterized protein n=1 Tax=Corynebacterium antarcticum TaxID=2800405 RepID=A0ABS1FND2_9CORY|nr:hypothetical protein [Corynebacterium antarcticum]MCK7642046.1 hypothetical protein [Corynebacterium antarcticum]MCK7659854.1 hypothetical protein [Corynebacterium antarcticum]MCL0245271.1 hypothetical protein [Corynebacterium antarcticum]MCX7492892.1 hypothetical protein [Corynebacterium antarcticum]MCX7539180.1 hypothetical protein [Corynebacterium antarcticum]
MTETLTVTAGAEGLRALLSRATGIDADASARFRQRADGSVDVFVTTPFDVIAARRVEGTAGRDGAVVRASDLRDALTEGRTEIGTARDIAWPGALPPAGGFTLLDTLPVTVVRQLADQGQALARQFSGPLGPPQSLLDQTVLTVTASDGAAGDPGAAEITMRMVFTCTSLGLIPGAAAPESIPRHLRVSGTGTWVRVDAPFGTVYRSTRQSVLQL